MRRPERDPMIRVFNLSIVVLTVLAAVTLGAAVAVAHGVVPAQLVDLGEVWEVAR